MQIRLQNAEQLNLEQIREFLKSCEPIEFSGQNRSEMYAWVQRVLVGEEHAVQQRGAIRGPVSAQVACEEPGRIRAGALDGWVRSVALRRLRSADKLLKAALL